VVMIVAILAAVVLPSADPSIYDQLRATAQIVATDLDYARGLAVANNDNYQIAFDLNGNWYRLTHVRNSARPELDHLPPSPFSLPSDPDTQHTVNLDDLPNTGPTVRLAAVATLDTNGTPLSSVSSIVFNALGGTDQRTNDTQIWLMAGNLGDRKYMTVRVNYATGLAQVGGGLSAGPPPSITQIP
jgi:hypothetical protein